MAQTILVVDDDASIRDAVSFYMRREGYDVLQAKDGQAAMEVIATENFDLAILDIMMEGYNGFELCSAIRDRNQTVPIILLSAKRDLIDKSLGFKLGADDYITKPFEPAELVMRVNSCLRRSQAFAEKSEGANGDGGSTIILGDLSHRYPNAASDSPRRKARTNRKRVQHPPFARRTPQHRVHASANSRCGLGLRLLRQQWGRRSLHTQASREDRGGSFQTGSHYHRMGRRLPHRVEYRENNR